MVSHLPSILLLMSSSKGFSPGCLARRARMQAENLFGTGGKMARLIAEGGRVHGA